MSTVLLTALAPAVRGTTYIVTTELMPADRPLLTALLRAFPAGLLLTAVARQLSTGEWWWRTAVLRALNIGAFFRRCSSPATGFRAILNGSQRRAASCSSDAANSAVRLTGARRSRPCPRRTRAAA